MSASFPLPPQCLALAASTPGSILLQTARVDQENYRSYLFAQPKRILSATVTLFEEVEQALSEGAWVAGFLSYEYGAHLHGNIRARESARTPPAWFGVYAEPHIFNHQIGRFEGREPSYSLDASDPADDNYEIRDLRLDISAESHAGKIAAIHEYIRAGDTYQVNFTDKFHFDFSGSPQSLFAALSRRQPVPYSAFLHTDHWDILSFSPELFFRRSGGDILTRPMKGTAPRGLNDDEDRAFAEWLQNNPKNRSENVMIVDLLRNDLGRICEFGSIHVNRLFSVEKYDTLFQMTSEISGKLRPNVRYTEIFQSLFPCGSITGAPKLRTMEIIRELESHSRGVYTGAIGFFSPHSEAVFNVPIRTVVLESNRGEMGVGSGIVIDSQADEEYRECLLKSRFLARTWDSSESFQLLESLLWSDGYPFLSRHLDRLESSARYFDFEFDRAAISAALEETGTHLTAGHRVKVRLTLDRSCKIEVAHSLAPESTPGKVMLSTERVSSQDCFLRHKTTRRALYDRQYQLALDQGFAEVLFLNERGELTEGAISNVLLEKDGRWYTPPVSCGLLPGIYRQYLLETRPQTEERILHLSDLASADAIYLCNAVRGCTQVKLR